MIKISLEAVRCLLIVEVCVWGLGNANPDLYLVLGSIMPICLLFPYIINFFYVYLCHFSRFVVSWFWVHSTCCLCRRVHSPAYLHWRYSLCIFIAWHFIPQDCGCWRATLRAAQVDTLLRERRIRYLSCSFIRIWSHYIEGGGSSNRYFQCACF